MKKVKLGDVCEILNPSVAPFDGEMYYVATGDVDVDKIINKTIVTYNSKPSRANTLTAINDVLIAKMQNTLKVLIIDEKLCKYIYSTGFAVLRIKDDSILNPKLLYHIVKSDLFNKDKDKLCSGTTQKAINLTKLKKIEIPLPSIEEQERIVQILDQVYENIGWDIQDKIKDLKELKKSAIDKAIRGLLTTQNENESAEELYKAIQEEKEKLIKEGKIKKSKKDEIKPISEDEIPFEIPSNWKWCRLGDICRLITDGTHSTPKYTEYGIPFISVKDISNGFIDFSNTKYISMEEHQSLIKRCNPELKDILLTKIGTTGIAKVIDTNKPFSIFVSVALLKLFNQFSNELYMEYLINSPYVRTLSQENTTGVANKNLVIKSINNFLIPLPPLEEQERIVNILSTIDSAIDSAIEVDEDNKKLLNSLLDKFLNERD